MANCFSTRWLITALALTLSLNACAAEAQPISTFDTAPSNIPSQREDLSEIPADRIAVRPGDPRPIAYWAVWNTCALENRTTQAAANGGREAGWFLMDDLLADPGILVGLLEVQTCQQGLSLLQSRNIQGVEMQRDAAYPLAAQLLAAQLNLAVGSEYCPASDQVVSEAQILLLKLQFDGTGSYLGPPLLNEDVKTAEALEKQLTDYNAGTLCVAE